MIARAPRHAQAVLGKVLMIAGPPDEPVRWSGWSEVWIHPDGKRRCAFPRMSSIRDARGPDHRIHIRPVKETFIPC